MSGTFKFYKNEDKFVWKGNFIKVVFSRPHIQGFDEYSLVKDSKGIMYFYYTIKIFKKVFTDYDEKNDKEIYKWKLIAKRNTHDFPCITQLEWILEELIPMTTEITKTGEEHVYRSGKKEYSKHFCSEGFGCDDFYEITKFVDDKGNNPYYDVFVGCSIDFNGSLETEGIRKAHLKEDDMKELQKCVKEFLKYSIEEHNKIIAKRIELSSADKKIVEGKLYEYEIEKDEISEKIDSIYIVNDKLNLTMLKTTEEGDFCSEEYCITVKEIKDNKIISTTNKEFLVKEIMYIMDDVPKEKLKYNIDEVKKDFKEILTDCEKNDFRILSEEDLYKKYRNAIINRTWMCRTEHKFPKLIKKDKNHENVHEIVKRIIRDIKKEESF